MYNIPNYIYLIKYEDELRWFKPFKESKPKPRENIIFRKYGCTNVYSPNYVAPNILAFASSSSF